MEDRQTDRWKESESPDGQTDRGTWTEGTYRLEQSKWRTDKQMNRRKVNEDPDKRTNKEIPGQKVSEGPD